MPRLLHLSDTHLAAPGSPSEHPQLDPHARLETVLAAVADAGPFDAVVLTGDIADDGSVDGADWVRSLVAPLAPVVLAVPGNHDRTSAVAEVFGTDSVRLGAWRLVGAGTNVPGQIPGRADAVLDVLSSCVGPTVVLMHHPLRSRSTHEWFTLARGAELEARLLAHGDPLVLLSGHTHEAYEDTVGEVRLLGAPATYYGIAHDGEQWDTYGAPTGARIVELGDDLSVSTRLVLA